MIMENVQMNVVQKGQLKKTEYVDVQKAYLIGAMVFAVMSVQLMVDVHKHCNAKCLSRNTV